MSACEILGENAERWFVAQLKPGGHRLARENLGRQGFGVFCPVQQRSRRVGSRLVDDFKLLFPGYIFVNFDPAAAGWRAINSTRGIARLLLSDPRSPKALPAELMEGLIHRCDAAGVLRRPVDDLAPGDRVRILSGPFASYVTRVEALTDAERIRVLIDLLNQPVRTTLSKTDVEKIG